MTKRNQASIESSVEAIRDEWGDEVARWAENIAALNLDPTENLGRGALLSAWQLIHGDTPEFRDAAETTIELIQEGTPPSTAARRAEKDYPNAAASHAAWLDEQTADDAPAPKKARKPAPAPDRPKMKDRSDVEAELAALATRAESDERLSDKQREVYRLILTFAAKVGVMECVASRRRIASRLDRPPSSVRNDLRVLTRCGYLRPAGPEDKLAEVSKKIVRQWTTQGTKATVWKLPREIATTPIDDDLIL